ncbi:MAG: lysophospholipid acyltransferase family protein [Pseudomonadota bacterium]
MTDTTEPIDFTYATDEQGVLRRNLVRGVESMTGQRRLRRLYMDYTGDPAKDDFFDTAIDRLELDVRYNASKLQAAPKTGPLIFIANHPYGVADGVVLTWLLRKVRADAKVMANHVLCQAPEAAGALLPVDFTGNRAAMETNVQTRKAALATLMDGGALGIFPAGGVAASQQPFGGPAVDPQWHKFLAKLVLKSGATVVPLYFCGQNSRLFQIASHYNYTVRLALFFRETHRLMGKPMDVAIGDPISPLTLSSFDDRKSLVAYLRERTYALAPRPRKSSWDVDNLWEREFVYPSRLKF